MSNQTQGNEEKKTFNEFIDELLCKQANPYDILKDPKPYQKYKNIDVLVQNEIFDRLKDMKWFQEYRPDIQRVVSLAVAATLYVQSLSHDKEE